MIGNPAFVTHRDRERIEASYQAARGQLNSERHPLVLTNLLGEWVCFPLPYLNDSQLESLDIKSEAAPVELLVDDGWLPGIDEISSSDYSSQPAPIHRPQAITQDDSPAEPEDEPKLNLEAIEGIVFEVLAGADEPMKSHEIKRQRRPLKNVGKDAFAMLLAGMARRGDLRETDEENPRYSLP
jgi:hypothetical protein